MKYILVILLLLLGFCLFAQENWDIDSFLEQSEDIEIEIKEEKETKTEVKPQPQPRTSPILSTIRQRGFVFTASYQFNAGVAPGWYELPWDPESKGNYYLDRYIKMRSSFTLDAQISSMFRVYSNIYYEIPLFAFKLGNFYFDYVIYEKLFVRGGKYSLSWGISPVYEFTDLLARVPTDGYKGDSYILKADYPIDKGGIQVLALTRVPFMTKNILPKKEDIGFGGKYNLAIKYADFNLGLFYQEIMPLRSFLSVKSTLFNTELYTEGLISYNLDSRYKSGAFNIGFSRDFFDNKLTINGEFFYNAEKDTLFFNPETEIQEATTSFFIEGFNMAININYRPKTKGDPRLFLRTRYNPLQNSALVFPSFRLSPFPNLQMSLGVPITLGDKDGYYFKNTTTKAVDNKNQPLPFAVIFLVRLSGNVRFQHKY